MKISKVKYILFSTIILLPIYSHASTSTSTKPFASSLQTERLKVQTETKKSITESKVGTKIKLDLNHRTKIKRSLASVFSKMLGSISRIGQLDKQIQNAITIEQKNGTDVSNIMSLLKTARQTLDTSRIDMDAMNAGIGSAVDGGLVSKEAVIEEVTKTRALLDNAVEAYKKVVEALPQK